MAVEMASYVAKVFSRDETERAEEGGDGIVCLGCNLDDEEMVHVEDEDGVTRWCCVACLSDVIESWPDKPTRPNYGIRTNAASDEADGSEA